MSRPVVRILDRIRGRPQHLPGRSIGHTGAWGPPRGPGRIEMVRLGSKALAIGALTLMAAQAAAQTATSTVVGVVTDASGGALAGATVTARHAATGTTRQDTTDSAG